MGSSSYLTNSYGVPSHYYNYLPFGKVSVSQNQSEYNNVYRFSTKELYDETQLSYFGARYYDARLSYWLSIDPLAEKYPNISPYVYVANNPIMFIDPDGKEIIVPEKYRELFSNDLKNVFGDKALSLVFLGNKLVLNGEEKDFLKGMSKEQKNLFKGLKKVMDSKVQTTIVYEDQYELTQGKDKKEVDVNKDFGGGVYSKTDNTIVVGVNLAESVQVKLDVFPFNEEEVKQNSTTILFHEIGELNTKNLEFRGEVIDYENIARSIINMKPRPYDLNHSKTIPTEYKKDE